ncbi:hypothetical protein [Methanothermococcus okinawensis]|uniref:Uncharacterized protein n=1 Tax=Methanothermococcus okinawensis (strain DSM 14208 / JCM 11175 / IH1) TaxID=647113 RepID=F8AM20_METOI|nr:hypothetical protein [Methanothermococcus okinawensis]AEH06699.1 hypothetical protein Metok_0722 [Methanothermococcus okinawensis IH1]
MDSKTLVNKILNDIYKNLDEYSKDLIRACNFDVQFKNLYITDDMTGKKYYIRNLMDCEDIPLFEAQNRIYRVKKVSLEKIIDEVIILYLSSRKSKDGYSFEVDSNYKVVEPMVFINYEHKERILMWNELTEEELDEKLADFDMKIDAITEDILKKIGCIDNNNFVVYVDVFMDLEIIKNITEKEGNMVMIWIHPLFIFSDNNVVKGIIAYELSKYNKNILEMFYKDIIEYCKEYKKLCSKNLKILDKIKEIAIKRNDKKVIEELKEMEFI